MTMQRLIAYIFLPILFSLIISALVSLQLFQDGSSYLFELLVTDSAIRHHRLGVYLIQMPPIIIDKVLTRWQADPDTALQIVRLIFSLSYALIPLIALALSWLVIRKKHEGLFVWIALIILFVNLVNFSWVSELLIALQLSCSLLLASLVMPSTKPYWILMVILLPIIFSLHPLVLLLFITLAAGSLYISYKKVEFRKAALFSAMIFLAAAILRGLLSFYMLTSYEAGFLESAEMNEYLFLTSFENKLFLFISLVIGLICLLAKTLTNLWRKSPDSRLKFFYISCISLAVFAGLVLLSQYFSGSGSFPLKTGLALFASLLIMLMASLDSVRKISDFESAQRFRLVIVLSIIFSVVLVSKSLMWHFSLQKLKQSLLTTNSVCIELAPEDFPWLEKNPHNIINNWSLPTLALVMQDHHPRKLLLEEHNCQLFYQSDIVQIDPWTTLPKNLIVPPLN